MEKDDRKEPKGHGIKPSRRQFLKSGSYVGLAGLSLNQHSQAGSGEGATEQGGRPQSSGSIVLENREIRLRISPDGRAESLVHKPSGQECLMPGTSVPMFTLTQDRPYVNELQLRFPAKRKTFPARSVVKEGDRLILRFELVDQIVTLGTRITDAYIAFTIEKVEQDESMHLRPALETPADEMWFLQLPVKTRTNFGEWLNVMWDDQVAVNVLATGPYTRIDSEELAGHWLMQAGTVDEVMTEGVGAALIVCRTDQLMDRIDRVEQDYNLPRGVQSRRRKEYSYSYFWLSDVKPDNIDEYIRYARQSGFRTMMIYYTAFTPASGHYVWRPEYPNKLEDLKTMVKKIHGAGMLAGLHFHYNKTFGMDPYITPKPDPRLYLKRHFTLAAPLDAASTAIQVDENPRDSKLVSAVKHLRIGDEIVTYESYTTKRPYQFTGCKRGDFGTKAGAYEPGLKFGLLGEVAGVVGVFDQRTSIQEEVAERLAGIFDGAQFDFAYYDGAEDVPPPYWFNVSRAQWITYEAFKSKPMFAEGACKSHFSWHILTRGNAFDTFRPEVTKAAIREHPGEQAPRVAKDFTGINFGWTAYDLPSSQTIGTQPDMLEFVTSRAAAWDCPFSWRPRLEQLARHPRTADNLEVVKRWEDVRVQRWLTPAHKAALRNLEQEHILLIDEGGGFELAPCEHLVRAAGGNQSVRALLFERGSKLYVAFWHTSGQGRLEIPIQASSVRLLQELGKPGPAVQGSNQIAVPIGNRAYLEFSGKNRNEIVKAIEDARLLA
jgi:hypothetical protein